MNLNMDMGLVCYVMSCCYAALPLLVGLWYICLQKRKGNANERTTIIRAHILLWVLKLDPKAMKTGE